MPSQPHDHMSESVDRALAAPALRFQAGGAVRDEALYVVRAADRELPAALTRGALCYVLATRQIGKSSLRRRAVQRLRDAGVLCVDIDITLIGTDDCTATQWYYGLTNEIARQLELPAPDAFWDTHCRLRPVHRFSRYLEDEVLTKVPDMVVVFLDEIDATRSLSFSRDDFFAALRALHNRSAELPDHQRMTFCLLGVAAPGDLIDDATRTPFNIGEGILLEDFSREQLEAFAPGLAALGSDANAETATKIDTTVLLDELFAWTAGHPYMTQRVCAELARDAEFGQPPTVASVAEVVRRRFLHKGVDSDPNVQFAARTMGGRQPLTKGEQVGPVNDTVGRRMLALYRRLLEAAPVPARTDDPVQQALMLTGLAAVRTTAVEERVLAVRNQVFRLLFDQTWVANREAERALAEPLARWRASGRADDELLIGRALVEVEEWARGRDDLTPDEQEFLQACIRISERRRGYSVLVTVLVTAVLALAAVLGVLWWQYRRAEDAASEARNSAADSEVGRLAIASENAQTPLLRSLLAREAWRAADGAAVGMRFLAERALGNAVRSWPENTPLTGHTDQVVAAAFGPDGTHIVTSSRDHTARVWSVDDDGEKPIVLRGHNDMVTAAAFSQDGTRIVTASRDQTARIWRADGTGQPIVLRGHEAAVTSAAFSPDDARIVTASDDHTARMWQSDHEGESVTFRGHEGVVHWVAWNSDGTQIVTASKDRTARVWKVDGSGDALVLRGHSKEVVSAVFSSKGQRIVTASHDNTARVWQADGIGNALVLRGHWSSVVSAEFSPDGKYIVTASLDNTASVWRADGVSPPIVLRDHEDSVNSARFSPSGSHIVTASADRTARVWEVNNWANPLVLRGHDGAVLKAEFSPDGTRVVTASQDGTARIWVADGWSEPIVLRFYDDRGGREAEDAASATLSSDGMSVAAASPDNAVKVWRVDRNSEPMVLRGHEKDVTSVNFSPDGTRIITTSDDKTVRVWDVDGPDGSILHRGREVFFKTALFSPDSTHIIAIANDGSAQLWQVDGIAKPIVLGHGYSITDAKFNPDSTHVVTTSLDDTAHVWRIDGNRRPRVLRGHKNAIVSAAFSPDGTRIVTASLDGTALVWPAQGMDTPIILRGHEAPLNSAEFSPDGTHIVTASLDTTARVWRANGAGVPVVLRGHENAVVHAAFSPDGTRIVTASGDHTAQVWRVDGTGEPLVLHGHEDIVWSAMFSPDGTRILTNSSDGTVRIWNMNLDSFTRTACRRVGRNFTRQEWARYFPARQYSVTCPQWPRAQGTRDSL